MLFLQVTNALDCDGVDKEARADNEEADHGHDDFSDTSLVVDEEEL